MRFFSPGSKLRVIILTLVALLLTACSSMHQLGTHEKDSCKNHAYVNKSMQDYISRRYPSGSPVRMAIVPFSTPANLAARDNQLPGLGSMMAWRIHQEVLHNELVPIAEVMRRIDWGGKREEFHTGNFGAITLARDAGYDLVLVGFIDPMRQLDTMVAQTKVIDVASGTTIWYGRSRVEADAPTFQRRGSWWNSKRVPSHITFHDLVDDLALCVSTGLEEEPV